MALIGSRVAGCRVFEVLGSLGKADVVAGVQSREVHRQLAGSSSGRECSHHRIHHGSGSGRRQQILEEVVIKIESAGARAREGSPYAYKHV